MWLRHHRAASFSSNFAPLWQLAASRTRAGPAEWRHLARTFPWNMHSDGARRYPVELMAFTARGQPEIWQIGRTLGRRPAGARPNSLGLGPTSVLQMYARRPTWMWLSQRALSNPGELSELAQIFNSTNLAGPLSKCDLSIRMPYSSIVLRAR